MRSFIVTLSVLSVVAAFPDAVSAGFITKGFRIAEGSAVVCLRVGSCRNWAARGLEEKGASSAESYLYSLMRKRAAGEEANTSPLKRTTPVPDKPKRGCAAICRADANDNIPGNVKNDAPKFAFGEAVGPNCPAAVKEAKRKATQKLGMQPKHIGCETAGK